VDTGIKQILHHRPGTTDRHPSSQVYECSEHSADPHGSACSPTCYFVPCFVPRQRHPWGCLPGFVFLLTSLFAYTFKERAKWR